MVDIRYDRPMTLTQQVSAGEGGNTRVALLHYAWVYEHQHKVYFNTIMY
jgi:hypothetical protein